MTTLATGSADGTAAVWRVAQPGVEEAASAHDPNGGAVARVDVLEGHPSEVYGVTFVGDVSQYLQLLASFEVNWFVVSHVTKSNFWSLSVQHNCACFFRSFFKSSLQALKRFTMGFVISIREIKTGDIHARVYHFDKHFFFA